MPRAETPPVRPDGYDDLSWAPMPPPVDDLGTVLRARLKAAPSRRAAIAARDIGWLFSEGPDPTV